MTYKDRYKEFEPYLTSGKPGQREKADAWQTAIAFSSVYYVSRWNIKQYSYLSYRNVWHF